MKENTHPDYREVLFEDTTCGKKYIIRSTIKTGRTIEHEGTTYPYVRIEVSSESHPFYTGKQTNLSTDNRVKKFQDKFGSLLNTASSAASNTPPAA